MQKKYLTYIPSALAIVLIMSIIAVVLSIVNHNISPAHSIPNEQTSGDEEQNAIEDEQNDQEDVPNAPTAYHTDFPKTASESDDFLFVQSIQGYGNIELKNIHQTMDYIYAIIQTDSEFGDIQTDKDTVAVAMIS
ncbi:MAG: hypothetical protein ACOCWI_03165, partial [Bacillota bacterium]